MLTLYDLIFILYDYSHFQPSTGGLSARIKRYSTILSYSGIFLLGFPEFYQQNVTRPLGNGKSLKLKRV